MSSTRQRLQKQEARLTGGVELVATGGEPVIYVDGQGYQYNVMFYADTKQLDAGQYTLWTGPAVEFGLVYGHDLTWLEAIQAMKDAGAVYVPVKGELSGRI